MNKANPIRLTTIAFVFVLSIFALIPSRSIDINIQGKSTAKFKVLSEATGFTSKHYVLNCLKDGTIGETENLVAQLEDENGQVLKKDINLGAGYIVDDKISLGQNLPSFSLSEGKVYRGDKFHFSYLIEYMNLGLDLVGGSEIVYEIPKETLEKTKGDINDILSIFSEKLNASGMKEIFVQAVGEDRILVQLPGLKKSEVENIKSILETQGKLEFKIVIQDQDLIKQAKEYVVRGKQLPLKKFPYKFVYRKTKTESGAWEIVPGSEILVDAKAKVTGKDIQTAYQGIDNQSLKSAYAIHITFNAIGTNKFGKLTEMNRGKQLAIILDDRLQSYPSINEPILGGQCQITGNFTAKEAENLVTVLRSGSMDVKPNLLTENTVGPTLGSDSIKSGLSSCIIGGSFVLAFMFIYYKSLGLIANIALVLNLITLMATMSFFGGTLTLPGIAGFALTIGMAVDATVLIFERLREETTKKQAIKASLSKGYARAFITIFDSNFTTFITALILYLVGNSGPVKGFCLSLMLGLAINLFAAVFVTQTLATWAVNNGKIKQFKMLPYLCSSMINFISLGKKVRYLSYAILFIGLGLVIVKKEKMLDVDFTGGNLLQINLTSPVDTKAIRSVCDQVNLSSAVIQRFGSPQDNAYTIRTRDLTQKEKEVFHQLLKSNLPVYEDSSLAFPRDITIGGIAAKEMLAYASFALIAAMLVILFYIMIRFTEFKYGLGACLALIHDVGITIGLLAIFDIQINLTIFAAILTVVGYSLNDTIVIFDRIRENIGSQKNYDLLNISIKSLNQTLNRTLLTSITTLFVILSLIFIGGGVIQGFAITMLIGLITGTYSSLFIATPFVIYLHNKNKDTEIEKESESNSLSPV